MFPPVTVELIKLDAPHKWLIFNCEARRYYSDVPTKRLRTQWAKWDVTVVVGESVALEESELKLLKRVLQQHMNTIARQVYTWVTMIDLTQYSMKPVRR